MASAGIQRRWAALGAAVLLCALALPVAPAYADQSAHDSGEQVAPGMTYRSFQLSTAHGPVVAYLLTVDLSNPKVELDLLHPPVVAARDEVHDMTNAQRAVAGVNGDFFHLSESHEGVAATGSSVGPEIADGEDLKAAVPNGQRFGPALPDGTATKDVFGLGTDRRARVSSVALAGTVRSAKGTTALAGLNQYAVPVDGIGLYTSEWGEVARARAVCGTDADRSAPCTTDTEEVVIRNGVVSAEQDQPGSGAIPGDTVVLVGREKGAAELEKLNPGDRVVVDSRLEAADAPPLEFAVGGFPILRGGTPLPGLDAGALAPRTSAGVSSDGRTVYLLAVDGRSAASTGMSVLELADLLRSLGAADGVNLDGGGSSTMAVRDPGQPSAVVKNVPSDGAPRAVANGIGVFSVAR
ncbi:phosphodiester glycosidase family protein [Saccharopolyspora pogona]|uniref:phosphodiester glycosidase family protein n=1 Tax=Saccharopolyspora pogona TaxID=333966 RepID=UPI001689DF79|nr:phosphodiester glycosidase family protein [Saccharopolyspora pogona]